jgi:hypothetical protein
MINTCYCSIVVLSSKALFKVIVPKDSVCDNFYRSLAHSLARSAKKNVVSSRCRVRVPPLHRVCPLKVKTPWRICPPPTPPVSGPGPPHGIPFPSASNPTPYEV